MRAFLLAFVVVLATAAVCSAEQAQNVRDLLQLLSSPSRRWSSSSVAVSPQPGTSRLFVSFCPTDFTNRLAVVDVVTATGKWSIVGTTKMPGGVFGCSALYDPTYSFDPQQPNEVILDFTSDAGYFVWVTIDSATNAVSTRAFNSRSLFFSGFLSFQVDTLPSSGEKEFVGICGDVTESGFCSDACIGFGRQNLTSAGGKERSTALPYRAISDDTSYLDRRTQTFYAQASHPLLAGCGASESWEDCMLAIDARTGAVRSSRYNRNEHCYRFGLAEVPNAQRAPHNREGATLGPIVAAFVVGMNARCGRGDNETSYAFAEVDLSTSNFTKVSCVSTKTIIHEGPWISSFSANSRFFVTSSGNGNGDDPQFLAFDVASGRVVTDTRLQGLARALKADMGLIFVWAVQAF
jgi:hypothetical protein